MLKHEYYYILEHIVQRLSLQILKYYNVYIPQNIKYNCIVTQITFFT